MCRGSYEGEEVHRFNILWKAIELGAPAIDVELAACDAFLKHPKPEDSVKLDPTKEGSDTTFIVSNHNFTFTPSLQELREKEKEMREKGADVAKLAVTANDVTDAWTMISLLQQRTGSWFLCSVAIHNKCGDVYCRSSKCLNSVSEFRVCEMHFTGL